MKNMFKYLAVAAMCVSLTGMVSCNDPKPEPEPSNVDPTVASKSYVFHYQNRTLEPGQTVEYYPTMDQASNDWATTTDIFIENLTNDALASVLKLEKVSGSAAFDDVMFCFGETCQQCSCPWTSAPVTLSQGLNEGYPIHVQYAPSTVTEETMYRITIGKGSAMEDPQVLFLRIYNAQ